ncbi:hypothetical protein AB0N06_33340 [Streptomyces sp. NPDC051020]|uniref:hypothetical protein n=1 Tax=Streptomyces sp. NPDC051020 TaxID=3155409 RepID=UPI00342B20D3
MRAAGTGTAEFRYGFGVSQGGVNHQDQVSLIAKSRNALPKIGSHGASNLGQVPTNVARHTIDGTVGRLT